MVCLCLVRVPLCIAHLQQKLKLYARWCCIFIQFLYVDTICVCVYLLIFVFLCARVIFGGLVILSHQDASRNQKNTPGSILRQFALVAILISEQIAANSILLLLEDFVVEFPSHPCRNPPGRSWCSVRACKINAMTSKWRMIFRQCCQVSPWISQLSLIQMCSPKCRIILFFLVVTCCNMPSLQWHVIAPSDTRNCRPGPACKNGPGKAECRGQRGRGSGGAGKYGASWP